MLLGRVAQSRVCKGGVVSSRKSKTWDVHGRMRFSGGRRGRVGDDTIGLGETG